MQNTVALSLEELSAIIDACLRHNGSDAVNAAAITRNMVWAEASGSVSHGIFRLPGYIASLKSGKANGKANPQTEILTPSIIKVDANHGFAPLAQEVGHQQLAPMAKKQGIAALSIRNCFHFAALWVEIERLTNEGLCAFATTAATPMVAPAGGIHPFFGTNPIAFGWPRKDKHAVIFDMATAATARGELLIAARDGHQAPAGAGLDKDGQPTTDPHAILDGAQLPFGGYKGSAIAMMVELLAGALIGDLFSYESGAMDNNDGGPPLGGELIIAMNPVRFSDTDFDAHAENFFAELTKQAAIHLPGNHRYTMREKTKHEGVTIPKPLYDEVMTLTGHS